jgi:hypothetical protein
LAVSTAGSSLRTIPAPNGSLRAGARADSGGAVPIVWIIGIILIVVGVVALFRRSLLMGVVLIVIGVLLGGLNVF